MKCVEALSEKERAEGSQVGLFLAYDSLIPSNALHDKQYDIIFLGGLSGRLDQTIHTLSYLYKLRKTRERVFTVTDENVAWILDSVSPEDCTSSWCFLNRFVLS